jgi:hypothetical protein
MAGRPTILAVPAAISLASSYVWSFRSDSVVTIDCFPSSAGVLTLPRIAGRRRHAGGAACPPAFFIGRE